MEVENDQHILSKSKKVRNRDRVHVDDLRKRVLLKNFLQHQVGIEPSLLLLRRKNVCKENRKQLIAKRVAFKSIPSVSVQQEQQEDVDVPTEGSGSKITGQCTEKLFDQSVVDQLCEFSLSEMENSENDSKVINKASEQTSVEPSSCSGPPEHDALTKRAKVSDVKTEKSKAKFVGIWKQKLRLNCMRCFNKSMKHESHQNKCRV